MSTATNLEGNDACFNRVAELCRTAEAALAAERERSEGLKQGYDGALAIVREQGEELGLLRERVKGLEVDAAMWQALRNGGLDFPLRLCSRDRHTSYHNSGIDGAMRAAIDAMKKDQP